MKKLGIYWFSNDLRIDDNPALAIAAQEVDQLMCIVFIQEIAEANTIQSQSSCQNIV